MEDVSSQPGASPVWWALGQRASVKCHPAPRPSRSLASDPPTTSTSLARRTCPVNGAERPCKQGKPLTAQNRRAVNGSGRRVGRRTTWATAEPAGATAAPHADSGAAIAAAIISVGPMGAPAASGLPHSDDRGRQPDARGLLSHVVACHTPSVNIYARHRYRDRDPATRRHTTSKRLKLVSSVLVVTWH
jgi:hypothetical protein